MSACQQHWPPVVFYLVLVAVSINIGGFELQGVESVLPTLLVSEGRCQGFELRGFELRGFELRGGFELMLLLLQDVISSQGACLIANKGNDGIADSYLNPVGCVF